LTAHALGIAEASFFFFFFFFLIERPDSGRRRYIWPQCLALKARDEGCLLEFLDGYQF